MHGKRPRNDRPAPAPDHRRCDARLFGEAPLRLGNLRQQAFRLLNHNLLKYAEILPNAIHPLDRLVRGLRLGTQTAGKSFCYNEPMAPMLKYTRDSMSTFMARAFTVMGGSIVVTYEMMGWPLAASFAFSILLTGVICARAGRPALTKVYSPPRKR